MRIIAGQFRGRRLLSARDRSVRPTTDRTKQSIFDMVSHRLNLEGIEVLDLFAGSGSLGLEALSRGARHVVFVDKARGSIQILEKNIDTLGCRPQCTVYPAEVFWFLKNTRRSFDLGFVDPPYRLEEIGSLPTSIYRSPVVRNGSYVVMEHSKESQIELSTAMYDILRKPFGQTTVLILQVKSKP
jgi:16S rRNA (guanine966-N2)-methyltransferase